MGAVAAPPVRDGILGTALSRAGLVAVPDDGATLDAFVRGAFRKTICERLGDDVAEGVLSELWPLLAMLARRAAPLPGRSPRVTARPAATARPAPARQPSPTPDDDDPSGVVVVVGPGKTIRSGESLPVIIAVMQDSARARALALRLVGKALIRPVVDLLEMGEAIEDHRADRPVVLFDCASPPFHLESVATFASELPDGSWLALLDASPEHERTARNFAGTTLTLARISSQEGTDVIAQRCVALFD